MPAYMAFQVSFDDRGWRKAYVPPTVKLIEKHGGRPLAGAAPERIEGNRPAPTMLVLLEFPSAQAARAWHADPEYRPLAELRLRHAPSEGLLVAGLPNGGASEARAAAYMIFELKVHDGTWREQYAEPTARLVRKHGGRYLARGPGERIEGNREPPTAVVVLGFPDAEAARAWHADPEYKPLMDLRRSGSTAEALLVPGL